MNRFVRFRIWIGCVFGLCVTAPIASQELERQPASLNAFLIIGGVSILCYIGLVTLLKTTPADAIKLSPHRSIMLISAGTTWLYAACWSSIGPTRYGIGIGLIAGLLAWLFSSLLIARRLPAWSTVVIMWCPMFVGPFAVRYFTAFEFCGIAVVLLLSLVWKPR